MSVLRCPSSGVVNWVVTSQTSRYVCRSCRKSIASPSISPPQRRHASNQNIPFTEKLRRKIWGTDNPPGLKDPYGGPGFFERRAQRRKAETAIDEDISTRTATQEPEYVEESPAESSSYPKSKTDLEHQLKPTPRDLPAQNLEKYVPAETWEGLEHIGSSGGWRTLPVTQEELPLSWKDRFLSSKLKASQLDFIALACILHQAIVESLISREAGQNEPNLRYQEEETVAVTGAKIILSPGNSISHLEFASKNDQELFIDILSAGQNAGSSNPAAVGEDSSTATNASDLDTGRVDAIATYVPEDQSFLNARFDFSQPLTFTILKRFSGLSGMTIPDPVLNALRSENKPLSFLIERLADAAKPKPKNLAETLINLDKLTGQSNVMVLSRRETPVDKEKEVGRWKIIEKELTSRGLPVLGKLRYD